MSNRRKKSIRRRDVPSDLQSAYCFLHGCTGNNKDQIESISSWKFAFECSNPLPSWSSLECSCRSSRLPQLPNNLHPESVESVHPSLLFLLTFDSLWHLSGLISISYLDAMEMKRDERNSCGREIQKTTWKLFSWLPPSWFPWPLWTWRWRPSCSREGPPSQSFVH